MITDRLTRSLPLLWASSVTQPDNTHTQGCSRLRSRHAPAQRSTSGTPCDTRSTSCHSIPLREGQRSLCSPHQDLTACNACRMPHSSEPGKISSVTSSFRYSKFDIDGCRSWLFIDQPCAYRKTRLFTNFLMRSCLPSLRACTLGEKFFMVIL
jgi:hypothetical protein